MSTRGAEGAESVRVLPSRVIWSEGFARSPSFETFPETAMRPASIQVSISRREPRPAAASSFCSRSPRGSRTGSAAGAGGALGFGLGAGFFALSQGRFGGGGRCGLKLESMRYLLERRQLFERAQAEVVEELLGGGVERRPAGRLAMADDVDPAARLERLPDLRRDGDAADGPPFAAGNRLAVGDDG